ncbi:DUF4469 domain-containing protein [Candidatus Electronema sp. JC]|uniref:DUF4469 domain-containing protein n=1 Tax=Candidatus Electronema sp. JC TaxID=3401570 RepID=UPI003B435A4F
MPTIQWRPAVNALTVPQSYKMLFVPRNTVGYSELAAEIAAENPNWNAELVEAVMRAERKAIQRHLINGDQITLEDAFSYRISFVGKLAAPDAPLPNRDDLIQVNIHASVPFMRELRHAAQLERLPPEQKQPLIAAAEDTKLKLKDVLNPKGVLKLTGTNLFFEEGEEGCGCVIEGTQSGRAAQSQFAVIANASVLLVPEIPAQAHPWNNEYILSISTQYTEHGTVRSGIYGRKLRSPLTLTNFGHPNPPDVGILTGSADSPYVSVTGGSVSADKTLRIQAVLDIHAGHLLFSLLDMEEGGKAGAVVTVTANGPLTLQGFAGSAVSSLEIRVNSFADLVKMARNVYSSRVVDVLEVRVE